MQNFEITKQILSLLPAAKVSQSFVLGNVIAIEIRTKHHQYEISFPQVGLEHPILIETKKTIRANGTDGIIEYFEEVKAFAELFKDADAFEKMAHDAVTQLKKRQLLVDAEKEAELLDKQKRKGFKFVKNEDEATKILNYLKKTATDQTFSFDAQQIKKVSGQVKITTTHLEVQKNKRVSLFVSFECVSQIVFKGALVERWIRGDVYSNAMAD